ncbi:MAG: zinc ribbon domain-containing protein, partial [Ktedonobacteraceae bacterium]
MALTTPLYCDACGTANRAQATFCFSCGQVLRASNAPQPSFYAQTGLLPNSHLLKQRYRVVAQLGKGGFGAVYQAVDMQFVNRVVAIK